MMVVNSESGDQITQINGQITKMFRRDARVLRGLKNKKLIKEYVAKLLSNRKITFNIPKPAIYQQYVTGDFVQFSELLNSMLNDDAKKCLATDDFNSNETDENDDE